MNVNSKILFEVSWEVCNKVGGIYTVISSKAKSLSKKYDNLIMIGPDLPVENGNRKEFIVDNTLLEGWRLQAKSQGLKIRVGRWNIPGRPIVVLIDFSAFYKDKNEILSKYWEDFKLDSIRGGWDYVEPVMFGQAAGKVIESYYKYHLLQQNDVIAHFHEWMTGSGILYLKSNVPAIGTVFTTHATILGRTIAGNHMPLYKDIEKFDPQHLANNFNIAAKYSLEKISAEQADAFSTVSSITSNECKYLLQEETDVVTPNGFDDAFVPIQNEFNIKKEVSKIKLKSVTEAVIGYELGENPMYLLNSGRYEFKNKGIDVFIKALNELNNSDLDREIVAYIAVPAGNNGPNQDVLNRLNGLESGDATHICTHNLSDPDNDPVLKLMKELGLNNKREDKVKIIFTPVYLDGNDGIIDIKYYDFMIGFHMTAFPSYYEPWGYTPMESLAFSIPTITTSLAGFGSWIKNNLDESNNGAFVIERTDTNDDEVVDELKNILYKFAKFEVNQFFMACLQAKELSKLALWNNLVENYVELYDIAFDKGRARRNELKSALLFGDSGSDYRELDSKKPVWKKIFIKQVLPKKISFLEKLSKNLCWTWNKRGNSIFKSIDPELWESVGHNPVELLEKLDVSTLDKLSKDKKFTTKVQEAEDYFNEYMNVPKPKDTIAYFSMEFGLHDTVQIFSGGLGILAGDYMKEASDSNYNMVGVGLLYRNGYFKQKITLLGDQISTVKRQTFTRLPVKPIHDSEGNALVVDVSLPGRKLYAKVWYINVGRNKLYLLDTDIPLNINGDREITSQLYGGGQEMRLLQEILLGICGVRLLEALDIKPSLVHINEGHAAFTGIERLKNYITKDNLEFDVAKELVKASSLFTTHTPVPAGHDAFSEDMIRAYLPNYFNHLKISWDEFISLGRMNPEDTSSKFSMSVLAANLSQEMNGVSKIHGEVSREMFSPMYPGYYPQELHISHVTNGVHLPFWIGSSWYELFKKHFDEDFSKKQLDKELWSKIYSVDDKDIWSIRNKYRTKLVDYLKKRIKKDMVERNESPKVIFNSLDGLRDDVLTIGFARRFATYKRALLLFKNLDKLKELVNNKDMPIQLIFAGKAHPKDKAGQDLIKKLLEYSKSPDFIGKLFFVENYDITLAKHLVQGVDVWLNNPTRPLEASGTSGEKAVMNGVLNLSVLDGWWAEGYREGAGWALSQERTYENQEFQDSLDALTIYDIIEDEIQPKFYDRNKNDIPEEWVKMIKKNFAEISPNFTMKRMIEDYNEKFYKKQIVRAKELHENDYQLARELADWKKQILEKWDSIKMISAEYPSSGARPLELGEKIKIMLKLNLDELNAEDVGVEVLIGSKRQEALDEVELLSALKLELKEVEGSIAVYGLELPITMAAGIYDYTFRVFPDNKMLPHRMDFPLVKWI